MFLVESQNVENKRMEDRSGVFLAPVSTLGGRGAFQGSALLPHRAGESHTGHLMPPSDAAGITLLIFCHQTCHVASPTSREREAQKPHAQKEQNLPHAPSRSAGHSGYSLLTRTSILLEVLQAAVCLKVGERHTSVKLTPARCWLPPDPESFLLRLHSNLSAEPGHRQNKPWARERQTAKEPRGAAGHTALKASRCPSRYFQGCFTNPAPG